MNNVLFLCVANSARSQMAEGLARDLLPAGTTLWSAGSSPAHVNPFAVRALLERGIDISDARAKGMGAIPLDRVETVITLCAEEVCPVFPRPVPHLPWPIEDPAAATGSDEERLDAFRTARDEIERRLEAWIEATRPSV